jgi:hypothetical protein
MPDAVLLSEGRVHYFASERIRHWRTVINARTGWSSCLVL